MTADRLAEFEHLAGLDRRMTTTFIPAVCEHCGQYRTFCNQVELKVEKRTVYEWWCIWCAVAALWKKGKWRLPVPGRDVMPTPQAPNSSWGTQL